jgi:hypothetical protein
MCPPRSSVLIGERRTIHPDRGFESMTHKSWIIRGVTIKSYVCIIGILTMIPRDLQHLLVNMADCLIEHQLKSWHINWPDGVVGYHVSSSLGELRRTV